MRRLFAFGCSYTSYSWPTWADLLGVDFEFSKNYGLAGIGNQAIAERVAEANARHHFTKDDIVIVQWSSHLRNDFFNPYTLPERIGQWKTAGSIFNYMNEKIYDKKWIQTFFYEPAYFMHTLNFISMTQGLLESTGCKWYMTSIGDVRNMGADIRDNTGIGEHTDFINPGDRNSDMVAWKKIPELSLYNDPIWKKYAEHWLTPMETFAKTKCPELTQEFIDTKKEGETFFDTHPSTTQHMMWLKEELVDKLNISEDSIKVWEGVAQASRDVHQKFKFDKHLFELMISKRTDFPETATNLKWPFRYEGF